MDKVQQIQKLYEEVKKELLQVTWPDKKEMTTAIIIVSFAVLIAGSAFFAVDYCLYNFLQLLIKV